MPSPLSSPPFLSPARGAHYSPPSRRHSPFDAPSLSPRPPRIPPPVVLARRAGPRRQLRADRSGCIRSFRRYLISSIGPTCPRTVSAGPWPPSSRSRLSISRCVRKTVTCHNLTRPRLITVFVSALSPSSFNRLGPCRNAGQRLDHAAPNGSSVVTLLLPESVYHGVPRSSSLGSQCT